jgi:hypothetical protein
MKGVVGLGERVSGWWLEKGVRNRFPADGLQVDTSITENGS